MVTQNAVINVLRNIKVIKNGRDIVELHFITGVEVNRQQVVIHFKPGLSTCSNANQPVKEIALVVKKYEG